MVPRIGKREGRRTERRISPSEEKLPYPWLRSTGETSYLDKVANKTEPLQGLCSSLIHFVMVKLLQFKQTATQ